MKIYFAFLLVLLSITGKSQNKETINYNNDGSINYKTIFDSIDNPILLIYYYKTGVIQYIMPIKDKKLNGILKQYNKKGRLIWEMNYKDGIRQGNTLFYLSKTNTQIYRYDSDVKDPVYHVIHYYNNGKIKSEYNNKTIEGYGLFREYYDNGNIKTEGNYVGVKRDGVWKFYNYNGSIRKTKEYKMKYVFSLKQIF